MKNLKYLRSSWEWLGARPTLLYVEFECNGHKLKWYPKWGEIEDLFSSCCLTEAIINRGKHNALFKSLCRDNLKRIEIGEKSVPVAK